MASDPRATGRTLDNSQPNGARLGQEPWSFNIPKHNGDDNIGERSPDERHIEHSSTAESNTEDEAQTASHLSSARVSKRRPEVRQKSPSEDTESDNTRRERLRYPLPDVTSQCRTDEMDDDPSDEDAGPYADNVRGRGDEAPISTCGTIASQARTDEERAGDLRRAPDLDSRSNEPASETRTRRRRRRDEATSHKAYGSNSTSGFSPGVSCTINGEGTAGSGGTFGVCLDGA